jgi:hypothetical protein
LNYSIDQGDSIDFSVFALMMFGFSGNNYAFYALGRLSGFKSLNPKIHIVLKVLKVSESVYVPAADKMTQSFSGLIRSGLKETNERRNPWAKIGTIEYAGENIYPSAQSISFVIAVVGIGT